MVTDGVIMLTDGVTNVYIRCYQGYIRCYQGYHVSLSLPCFPQEKGSRATHANRSYFATCHSRPFAYEEFANKKISCKENEEVQ